MKRLVSLTAVTVATLLAASAEAASRDEVMSRASAYAAHPWRATSANTTASCSSKYVSLYQPGDYVGLPYDWGGYMSLFEFDKEIAAGYGAGAQETDGILDCTAGVDCSGFVSQAWGADHFTTSTMDQTSSVIAQSAMLPGDVFNKYAYHVAMFTGTMSNGEPSLVESVGYNVHVNVTGGFSHVNGYTPRRYSGITGTTVATAVGTPTNPIVIGSFPYTDSRDTRLSVSSALGGCGLAPNTSEGGPEYVYKVNITQPGTLTVSSSDDGTADIDVEVFTQLNSNECQARHDSSLSTSVGCGTYYIVADTFGSAAKAGSYTLNVNLTPSGQACGAVAGPPAFAPKGTPGSACAYPGNKNLPFCNENLGSDTCIYTSTTSFCSKACTTNADCTALAGGCCQDISGKGEFYCMTQALCGGSPGVVGTSAPPSSGAGDPSGTSGGNEPGSSSGATDGDPEADPGEPNAGGASAAPGKTTTTTGCAMGSPTASAWPLVVAFAVLGAARRRRRH